ncbi:MAG: M48 family metalloprotease [Candidatus Eremiobacteraeota bacterium]|nr:M48 family metalloprotease [Candidatus Eremiobacteraeota bacterium]MBV8583146.1 M48 family metalloprotease [Candidatus Eremiobacteraeota bacterium]
MTRGTRKLLLGLGAGLTAGYLAFRTWEAVRQWRDPQPTLPRDARAYARTRRRLEVAETVRTIAATVAFAYGPFGEAADRATLGVPAWLRPALLIGPLSLLASALDLPVAFVEDHTLERRYGLSDQSRDGWLADYVKSSALGAGLSMLVASLFGIAVRHAPRRWPLVASAGVFPLFVLGNLIVPLYIMPLFNDFSAVTGSLEVRLRALAGRFGVGDAEILRMDMSRQTRKANAFVTGIGRTHRIVLGDTLIDAFPESEIEFVVAHELGHYVTKDTWRLIGVGEAVALAVFTIAFRATPQAEREELRKHPLLLLRFYAIMLLATQALRPLLFGFSRSREWAADRFALETTQDPDGGAAAFRRLRDQNLADEDPPGWYEFFFSSHPSLRKRIAALEGNPA